MFDDKLRSPDIVDETREKIVEIFREDLPVKETIDRIVSLVIKERAEMIQDRTKTSNESGGAWITAKQLEDMFFPKREKE